MESLERELQRGKTARTPGIQVAVHSNICVFREFNELCNQFVFLEKYMKSSRVLFFSTAML